MADIDFSTSYWKGRPLTDLSRDELLEIIVGLAAEVATVSADAECLRAETTRLRFANFRERISLTPAGETETIN